MITFKSFRFNDTQSVRCNSGFKLAGSAVRRCRGNGFWDGKQARCSKFICSLLSENWAHAHKRTTLDYAVNFRDS